MAVRIASPCSVIPPIVGASASGTQIHQLAVEPPLDHPSAGRPLAVLLDEPGRYPVVTCEGRGAPSPGRHTAPIALYPGRRARTVGGSPPHGSAPPPRSAQPSNMALSPGPFG